MLRSVPEAFTLKKIERLTNNSSIQVQRLSRLVGEMLDTSRISTGNLSINFVKVDLSSFLRDRLQRFSDELENAKCEVFAKIEPGVVVDLDALRFEQVIANLITNAAKYASGHPVNVTLASDENQALLVFRDHGPGIPQDKLGLVFERFERLGTVNEVSGLGLGLHISKEIIRPHGGEICVESDYGYGARFIIEVPLNHLELASGQ